MTRRECSATRLASGPIQLDLVARWKQARVSTAEIDGFPIEPLGSGVLIPVSEERWPRGLSAYPGRTRPGDDNAFSRYQRILRAVPLNVGGPLEV